MLNEETKEALLEYLKALKGFAATRGDGPFFLEDREEAEDALPSKLERLKKALEKE